MKSFWEKFSLRERFLAIGVLVALGVVLLSTVLTPQIREMKKLRDEKTMLQKVIQNPTGTPAAAGNAEPVLPSEEAARSAPLSLIVSDLARLVESHQLSLSSVKPAPPEDKGDYWEYKVAIDLRGRYRNVVEFLDGMEQLPRWMIVYDVRIEENTEKLPGVLAHLNAIIFEEKRGS